MARAAKKQNGILADLPKRVDRAQAEVEKTLRRTWKRTLEVLPSRTQTVVKNFTRQVEKQAADLERLRKRALKTAEARRKRLINEIETRATKAGKSVVARFDIASRGDLEALNRRVAQIERRVVRNPRPAAKAAAKVAA